MEVLSIPLYEYIQDAIKFIRSKTKFQPLTGIILGTGLGGLEKELTEAQSIPYTFIPHFPISTVQGHAGKLIFGMLDDKPVVLMSGRVHYYEGYPAWLVTLPIRVLKFLGIEKLIITNASGGINDSYHAGDICVLNDQINLIPDNPLRGFNDERFGPRFPDMMYAYDPQLIQKAHEAADSIGVRLHDAVYAGVQGPNLETPAEYRYLHTIGADLVGMSTVPEVIVARHMDLPVCVLSVVSNQSYPIEKIKPTAIEDVIRVAHESGPNINKLIRHIV